MASASSPNRKRKDRVAPGAATPGVSKSKAASRAGNLSLDKYSDKPKARPLGNKYSDPPKPKQGNHVSRFASARDEAHAKASKITGSAPKAPALPSPSKPSSKASTSSSKASSTPRRSTPTPAAPKASSSSSQGKVAKYEDFNKERGTSKSNNPLLDRKVGDGPSLRDRMKTREEKEFTTKTNAITGKNFDATAEHYTPKAKVDGSQYSSSKPTNNTSTAYGNKEDLSKPAKASNPEPKVDDTPSTKVDGSKYADKKPSNQVTTAFNGKAGLLEELRKRKTNR